MFGISYKLMCPYCKHEFITEHGITRYYKINGYGNNDYLVERCPKCNSKYFKLDKSDEIIRMKLNSVSLDDAIKKFTELRIKEAREHELLYKHITDKFKIRSGQEIESDDSIIVKLSDGEVGNIIKQCNEVYSNSSDFYIPVENIKESDLSISSVYFY